MGDGTIYARARAEIDRRGWRQGPSNDPASFDELTPDPDEPCCLLLALYDAGSADEADAARDEVLCRVGTGSVALWNDTPGRTECDVTALLDELDAEATQ